MSSTELKSAEITAMPLNRFRNYQALMNLVPGTTPMAFGNAETDTPARSLATNVNGQANTTNSTRTDGATNMNIWLPNHNMYISPAETIETVNVSTSSFDAEQGMAGGAAVTVVTKSGTNQFKGSGFEFYNSEKLNARPYFFSGGSMPEKLPVEQHTFGGTLGGPVKKNSVFFFGSFEGYKRDQSLFTFFSVPDAALRAGDFSKAVVSASNPAQQLIYNPFTGAANGVGRQPFANNQIPTGMIDPIALKIMNLFPMPNVTGIGAGGLTNNYQRSETRTVDRKNYDAKLNFNRTTAHQIWGKYSLHERGGRRSDQLSRSGSECRRRRRLHQGVAGHGRTDLDDIADIPDGHDVRVRAPEPAGLRPRLQRRQLRPRRARHSRDERPGHRRSTVRGVSPVQHRLQRGR